MIQQSRNPKMVDIYRKYMDKQWDSVFECIDFNVYSFHRISRKRINKNDLTKNGILLGLLLRVYEKLRNTLFKSESWRILIKQQSHA